MRKQELIHNHQIASRNVDQPLYFSGAYPPRRGGVASGRRLTISEVSDTKKNGWIKASPNNKANNKIPLLLVSCNSFLFPARPRAPLFFANPFEN